MKILFTSPVLEHPAAGGPQLRIENSIKALHRISELHILSRNPKIQIGGEEAELFFKKHCVSFSYLPSGKNLSIKSFVRKLQRLVRLPFWALRDAWALKKYCAAHAIDIVWFGYGNISYPVIRAFKKMCPSIPCVCDTDSVWSRFILREVPLEKDPARRKKLERAGKQKELEERQWVALCEATLAVSDFDAQYYRAIAPDANRVHVFANVIDLQTYKDKAPPPSGYRQPSIYLAGTFGHPHAAMNRAAQWVLDEVLPLVVARISDIHFYIVGSGSKTGFGELQNPHVTVTGKLPSVLPYLCNTTVALVPLQFESGTRFKILEAAACGIPIVSTTLGAEGLDVESGKHLLIADTPRAFADAIIKLIADQAYAAQLAQACKSRVQHDYSVDTLVRQGQAILSFLSTAKECTQ